MRGDLSDSFSYPSRALHESIPRPDSSYSQRSFDSISGSDLSYTTTEVDSDDPLVEEDVAMQATFDVAQGDPGGAYGVVGIALSGERSYPDLGMSGAATIDGGVPRGIGGSAEEEKKRKEWLEREIPESSVLSRADSVSDLIVSSNLVTSFHCIPMPLLDALLSVILR